MKLCFPYTGGSAVGELAYSYGSEATWWAGSDFSFTAYGCVGGGCGTRGGPTNPYAGCDDDIRANRGASGTVNADSDCPACPSGYWHYQHACTNYSGGPEYVTPAVLDTSTEEGKCVLWGMCNTKLSTADSTRILGLSAKIKSGLSDPYDTLCAHLFARVDTALKYGKIYKGRWDTDVLEGTWFFAPHEAHTNFLGTASHMDPHLFTDTGALADAKLASYLMHEVVHLDLTAYHAGFTRKVHPTSGEPGYPDHSGDAYTAPPFSYVNIGYNASTCVTFPNPLSRSGYE